MQRYENWEFSYSFFGNPRHGYWNGYSIHDMKFCIFDMDFSQSIYFLLSNISKINHRCSFSFYSISYWHAFRCICSIALSDMMDMQGSGVSGSAVDSRSWRATMDWIWNWDGIS